MTIDYQSLIDEAMLGIVRKILLNAQEEGLTDNQCFYISFYTNHPEVILSKHVKKRYPKEITIVLQYQYRDLQVLEDRFSVNISFNNIPENIEIPFAALTEFVDPSVNFSLQFKQLNISQDFIEEQNPTEEIIGQQKNLIEQKEHKVTQLQPKTTSKKRPEKKSGEVIQIDKFRKKTK